MLTRTIAMLMWSQVSGYTYNRQNICKTTCLYYHLKHCCSLLLLSLTGLQNTSLLLINIIYCMIQFYHSISTNDTCVYSMYMYSNTLYTVTMTHIICGINLNCCSLNQVLYNVCVAPHSSHHQSSPSTLHMRRVDQYNTHELLTVSNWGEPERAPPSV